MNFLLQDKQTVIFILGTMMLLRNWLYKSIFESFVPD